MRYTEEILGGVHATLFEITREIMRVCRLLDIRCFAIGGTAIGAHFWQGIIPWDDDVDLGMLREEYTRFLREAPALLGEGFVLQEFTTEPNTPFYWAKVMKRDTLFLEEGMEYFDIHHGIFVDIFPLDRIPNNRALERFHRAECAWFISAFSLYPYWQKRREIPRSESLYYRKTLLSRVVLGVLYRSVDRKWLYDKMTKELGWFNGDDSCRRVNVVRMPKDMIERAWLEKPQMMPFGDGEIAVPDHLEEYLIGHYPSLSKLPPEEERINHAPAKLSFDTKNGPVYE